MAFAFDFGFEAPGASWNDAIVAVFFASNASTEDLATIPGPTAIADTSRYIELFEMQVGLTAQELGIYAEIVGGEDPILQAAKRASEARARGKIPFLVGANRRITEHACRNPLVALWGKVGRPESNEAALLNARETVLAGVRSATSSAFQSLTGNIAIITSKVFSMDHDVLKNALGGITGPAHLSVDLDVLAPGVVQNDRSIEPGGFSWYDLTDALEIVIEGPGIAAVDITGTEAVRPRSPAGCIGAQIILKIAGMLAAAQRR
jgi:arginase family enzyme